LQSEYQFVKKISGKFKEFYLGTKISGQEFPSYLTVSIKKDNKEQVEAILTDDPPLNLNIRNTESQTLIMVASEHDAINSLTQIVQMKGSKELLDAVDPSGKTALNIASQKKMAI